MKTKGQSLVEFVVILPLCIFICVASLKLLTIGVGKIWIHRALYEAAICRATNKPLNECAQIAKNKIQNILPMASGQITAHERDDTIVISHKSDRKGRSTWASNWATETLELKKPKLRKSLGTLNSSREDWQKHVE